MLKVELNTQELEKIISNILDQKLQDIENIIIKHTYTNEIKGYETASQMLGITKGALIQRVQRGFYIENQDFYKKDKSQQSNIYFNRDNLLKREKRNNNIKSNCPSNQNN